MLKHLFKTLKISILCGSLLTFQSSVVFAAGTNTTDQNGVITNSQTHTFTKIDDTDMLASLTMLGGGFIAGRMVQAYTPLTMDVTIAGAAGAAFIAGEILSNIKFKGKIDEMTVQVDKKSDGTVNEEQIQRLQDLKKSYEEAKATTKTKKTMQLAAAAGFGIAAATAIYLSMTETGQIASCKAALEFTDKALTTCSTTVVTPPNPEAVMCGVCAASFKKREVLLASYVAMREPPGPSMLQDGKTQTIEKSLIKPEELCKPSGPVTTSSMSTMSSVCTPAVLTMIKNQTEANPKALVPTTDVNKLIHSLLKDPVYAQSFQNRLEPLKKNYFEMALSLFFPKAEASWLPLLGLSAGVAAVFIPMTIGTASQIDMLMYVPRNRAIAFGLLAATSFMASKASQNVMDKLDDNIKSIDSILADLAKMAAGIKAQNLQQQQISIKTIDPQSQTQANFSTNATVPTDCLASNSTTNCTSVTDTLKSMPGFANLPDSFKDIASQVTTVGDGVSGKTGISGSTLSGAQSLANKQNAVARLLANRQAAMEKLSNGKVNFAKEQQNLLNRLNAGNRKALQQGGMTASGMMASMGATPLSLSSGKTDDKDALAKKTPAAAGAIDMSAGAGTGKDKTLDLNFKEAAGQNAMAVDASGGTQGAKPAEYEIDSNEINGKNGPSLFEILSSRYIKSGYPKLLEEEPVKN